MTNTPAVASPFCSTFLESTVTVNVIQTATVSFDGTSLYTTQPTPFPTIAAQTIPTHIASQCQLATTVPLSTRLSSACSCQSLVPATVTTTIATSTTTTQVGVPTCAAAQCGTFVLTYNTGCGPYGDCACATDPNGNGVCVEDTSCDAATCSTDSDCGTGEICWTESCCGTNICAVTSDLCGDNNDKKIRGMTLKDRQGPCKGTQCD